MLTTVYIATSLDGFIARPDGSLDWLVDIPNPEGSDYGYSEFMKTIDAVVIGRGTYETVLEYPEWPYDKPVFVLSTTLNALPRRLEGKAELMNMSPKELLSTLEKRGLKSLYIDGGKTIHAFLTEDLIDRMVITRVPVLIGSGIPLFGYLENDIQFKQIETKVFENGLVRSEYERTQK